MSREKAYVEFRVRTAAASAATDTQYLPVSTHAGTATLTGGATVFLAEGFAWMYETTEANSNNTVDWLLDYTTDGTNFTVIHTNANPNGLLDSAAPLVTLTMMGDAASSGAAAAAVTRLSGSSSASSPNVRVPGNATLRFATITAGTGTVPALQTILYGHWA